MRRRSAHCSAGLLAGLGYALGGCGPQHDSTELSCVDCEGAAPRRMQNGSLLPSSTAPRPASPTLEPVTTAPPVVPPAMVPSPARSEPPPPAPLEPAAQPAPPQRQPPEPPPSPCTPASANCVCSDGASGCTDSSTEWRCKAGRFESLACAADARCAAQHCRIEEWTQQVGTSSDETVNSLGVTEDGSVLVLTVTNGGLTLLGAPSQLRKFDPLGTLSWTLDLGSDFRGVMDVRNDGIFVAERRVTKYDPSGVVLWTSTATSADVPYAISVDGADNTFVAGFASSGFLDVFLAKYDATGALSWRSVFGTPDWAENVYRVRAEAEGNALIAGDTQATLPGQSNAGGYDAFARKYDPDGTELWTRQFGSTGDDTAYALEVDAAGNVIVAGNTNGSLPEQASFGDTDAFVRKYDREGNELWTRQFGSNAYDGAQSLALTPSGSIVVAGATAGALPGKTSFGGYDLYVREYATDGTELWTWQLGSLGNDLASAVKVDVRGSVLVGGDTDAALVGQTYRGQRDGFVLKLLDPTSDAAALKAQ